MQNIPSSKQLVSRLLSRVALGFTVAAGALLPSLAHAVDGTWGVNSNGNWSTAGSWLGNNIPGVTSGTTNTDTALFDLNVTGAQRVIQVDAGRNLQNITFGAGNTGNFNYLLQNGSLSLTTGGKVLMQGSSGAQTTSISTGITIQGENATYTFQNDSTPTNRLLTINTVVGTSSAGNTTTLTLAGSNTGLNTISGVIGNGAGGGKLAIVKNGAGSWQLNNNNTFTGGFTINDGTVYTGVFGTSLGLGPLVMNGGGVELGGGLSNLTSVTLNGNMFLRSGGSGAGGTRNLGGVVTVANSSTLTVTAGSGITSGTAIIGLGTVNTSGDATVKIDNTNSSSVVSRLALSQAMTLGGNLTVQGDGQFLANSSVSGGGSLVLDSSFTGVFIAASSLTYTGSTVIKSGTLQLGNGTNLGSITTSIPIKNDGTILRNTIGASDQVFSSAISGSGKLVLAAAGSAGQINNVRLDATNTYTGDTVIQFGKLYFGSAGTLTTSPIILSGSVVANLDISGITATSGTFKSLAGVGGSVVTLGTKTMVVGDNTDTTFGGTITSSSSAGGLTKQGGGTMTLSGTNTYTGQTKVNAGTLKFAQTKSLYSGTTSSWTAANISVASGATLAVNVGGAGEFGSSEVTSLINSLDRAVNNNGLQAGSALAFDTTNAGGAFTIADSIQNTTSTGGGAVGVTKLGSGTLTLSGANSYSGGTTIKAGTLRVGSSNALGTGDVAINSGILDLDGTSVVAGGVTGSNGTAITSVTSATYTANVASGTSSYAGSITGAAAFAKSGAGTQVLTGSSNSTGLTTVNAGTLLLAGGASLGNGGVVVNGGDFKVNGSTTSAVAVGTGGTVSGTGTLGDLTVSSGGNVSPGNSIGILNTGNFSLESGAALTAEITGAGSSIAGGTYDQLNATGSVTLGGDLSLSLAGFTSVYGTIYFLINNDGLDAIISSFANINGGSRSDNIAFTLGGNQWYISYEANFDNGTFTGGNDLALYAIPEPGTLGLVLSLAAPLFLSRRRRS